MFLSIVVMCESVVLCVGVMLSELMLKLWLENKLDMCVKMLNLFLMRMEIVCCMKVGGKMVDVEGFEFLIFLV